MEFQAQQDQSLWHSNGFLGAWVQKVCWWAGGKMLGIKC